MNQKDSDPIHVDMNHNKSNQLSPCDSTNIGSIHDSDNIRSNENIFELPVHYPVHASPIFTYGSRSETPSPTHYSSS